MSFKFFFVLSAVVLVARGWPTGETVQGAQCTRANEQYVDCYLGHCQPISCSDRNKSLPCPAIQEPCTGGCVCKKGFLRNAVGQCIPEVQCDISTVQEDCPANEEYTMCLLAYCHPITCQQKDLSLPCPSVALPCKGGCVCNEGWLRDGAGKCVPVESCN